jgi:hypothetical protein
MKKARNLVIEIFINIKLKCLLFNKNFELTKEIF